MTSIWELQHWHFILPLLQAILMQSFPHHLSRIKLCLNQVARKCRCSANEVWSNAINTSSQRDRIPDRCQVSINSVNHSFSATRRSEEHTSELKSLIRNSYADFFLKQTRNTHNKLQQHKQYK